jgi:hypothetical protein
MVPCALREHTRYVTCFYHLYYDHDTILAQEADSTIDSDACNILDGHPSPPPIACEEEQLRHAKPPSAPP